MYTIDKSKNMNSAWNYLHRHLFILYYTYIAILHIPFIFILSFSLIVGLRLPICSVIGSWPVFWLADILSCSVSFLQTDKWTAVVSCQSADQFYENIYNSLLVCQCLAVVSVLSTSPAVTCRWHELGVVWCGGNGILTQASRHGGCCW